MMEFIINNKHNKQPIGNIQWQAKGRDHPPNPIKVANPVVKIWRSIPPLPIPNNNPKAAFHPHIDKWIWHIWMNLLKKKLPEKLKYSDINYDIFFYYISIYGHIFNYHYILEFLLDFFARNFIARFVQINIS